MLGEVELADVQTNAVGIVLFVHLPPSAFLLQSPQQIPLRPTVERHHFPSAAAQQTVFVNRYHQCPHSDVFVQLLPVAAGVGQQGRREVDEGVEEREVETREGGLGQQAGEGGVGGEGSAEEGVGGRGEGEVVVAELEVVGEGEEAVVAGEGVPPLIGVELLAVFPEEVAELSEGKTLQFLGQQLQSGVGYGCQAAAVGSHLPD